MGYVGRLAPSPTGRLHLGIARTSLLAWLDARAHGGRLILRIEDIDQTRCRPEMTTYILEDLRWLGLDWDAGPDRPGPDGPFVQSDRNAVYQRSLDALRAADRVYLCTCSRKEILRAASAPHGPSDEGPRYPETCRPTSSPTAAPANRADRTPAVRLKTYPGDTIIHRDRRLGDLSQDVHEVVGDFVLQRRDHHWAYQLAVTVDDALQRVTTVVRGDDLAGSTARQLLLRRLLNGDEFPRLETLHVPLLRDENGARIAKRTGGHTLVEHRNSGVSAEALVGRLAASVGLIPSGEARRPQDLLDAWVAAEYGARLVDQTT